MIVTRYAIDPFTGLITPYEYDEESGLFLDVPECIKPRWIITGCLSEDDALDKLRDLRPEDYNRLFKH